ncbi:hypothetical protein Cgig2_033932 [Carnegiea gigantea]|uniref:RNA binding (RRM/RBD/RNP motifs) family protein n=1 Tax=Carnegiea gigantea TaxID=171969 RepID=A0A9Q1GLW2_9CARY|nr:hypothetical protein Cgig2_033932 [Carnegiea gigantea]
MFGSGEASSDSLDEARGYSLKKHSFIFFDICVWCWHHIMEMAEKDETEGRCPACRTRYDKERIVGTAANCERLVAEINMEKKQKSQKAKIKSAESRKQLSSVRVIQRNLVYIVGLPLNLADEDVRTSLISSSPSLVCVLITSIGFLSSFCNEKNILPSMARYITYSKEDEAVRCIQSVHGFILDGRPLRMIVPAGHVLEQLNTVMHGCEMCPATILIVCTCMRLALRRTASQRMKSFQHTQGVYMPALCGDWACIFSRPAVVVPATSVKCSPPCSSSGRSGVLPPAASWGSRASNSNPSGGSLACSNGPIKQKAELIGLPVISTTASDSIQASILSIDGEKKCWSNEETHARQTKLEAVQAEEHGVNSDAKASEVSTTPFIAPAVKLGNQLSYPPVAESNNGESTLLLDTALSVDGQPCFSGVDKGLISIADGKIHNLCSDMSKMTVNKRTKEHSDIIGPNGLCLGNFLSPAGQGLRWHDSEKLRDDSTSTTAITAAGAVDSVSMLVGGWKSDTQDHELQKSTSPTEDDFDNQRLRDAVVVNQATISASPFHLLSHLRSPLQQCADAAGLVDYTVNSTTTTRKADEGFGTNVPGPSVASNGFFSNFVSCASGQGYSGLQLDVSQGNCIGRFDGGLSNVDPQSAVDLGESSIISNILDLDSWNDSLTSPQNLAKFLGETEKEEASVTLANSWKGQISNQSRFSFARQEESRNHLFDFESSPNNIEEGKNHSFGRSFTENRGLYLDRFSSGFGFPQHRIEPSDNLTSSHSGLPSISRCQISAPPGFSVPSRPPPPGFSSQERSEQTFDMKSRNHTLETSSLLRNPYQAFLSGNISATGDIELIDPAILAVGKGRLPSGFDNSGMDMRNDFHVQTPLFENDSRLQLLMQRSLSPHQNLRYTDVGDNFSAVTNAYGFTSRHVEQSQPSNPSLFTQFSLQQARNTAATSGHWDGWSEVQTGNDIGIAELLRNGRLGLNKFGMTSSGDLYNRSFRMLRLLHGGTEAQAV